MFEKIKEARRMREFIYSSRNTENKKVYWKCYRAYVYNSIIMRKDEFEVKFGMEYYDSFKLRFKDWVEYIVNVIETFFLKFIPANKRPSVTNYYITRGVPKPIHLKHNVFVNECSLEYFLNETGFKIASEVLTSLSSTYYIKRA